MKPKLGIISLTCCEGCEFVILDLGKRFLELTKFFDLKEFHLIEEEKEPAKLDLVFVEGSPVTRENITFLKRLRKKSKLLYTLGVCACEGGVQKIKNYHQNVVDPKFVYRKPQKISNIKILPLEWYVKIDGKVLGCPIDGDDFLRVCFEILAKDYSVNLERPVCFECQIKKYKCLLSEGKPCLGPASVGGCKAICLSGGLSCFACRGILKDLNFENFKKATCDRVPEEKFWQLLETYGVKDRITNSKLKTQSSKPQLKI
jgi:coenzyme F420-reducing hydrogenase gamma subunit